jgi:hypothetical protein
MRKKVYLLDIHKCFKMAQRNEAGSDQGLLENLHAQLQLLHREGNESKSNTFARGKDVVRKLINCATAGAVLLTSVACTADEQIPTNAPEQTPTIASTEADPLADIDLDAMIVEAEADAAKSAKELEEAKKVTKVLKEIANAATEAAAD